MQTETQKECCSHNPSNDHLTLNPAIGFLSIEGQSDIIGGKNMLRKRLMGVPGVPEFFALGLLGVPGVPNGSPAWGVSCKSCS
tara:strand:- start:902 stop:1150 length:249 start_codon:yes stop_codon:yes gene_type:complete